jgi:hypothetical protein
MFTRPTTPELLEAVSSLLRELRDHPETAPTAPLEVAVEVAGVIERRIEHEPRSLVAGTQEIEDLARGALAVHADDADLLEAVGTYERAWPSEFEAAEGLDRYEAAGVVLSAVSDAAHRHSDADLIDRVFDVHTLRFERRSLVIGEYEAAGRT